jgi:hypothetical protein
MNKKEYPHVIRTEDEMFLPAVAAKHDEGKNLYHVIALLHPDHIAQLDRIEEKLDRLLELLSPSP